MTRKERIEKFGAMGTKVKVSLRDVTPNQPDIVKPVVKPVVEVGLDPEELEHRKRMRKIEQDIQFARAYDAKHQNAARDGNPFDLTFEEWRELMLAPVCAYSGKVFNSSPNSPYSRTMERINPRLGYTPDNTVAVVRAANTEKSLLDAFIKGDVILPEMKVKLLRKALYQAEKLVKIKGK